MYHEIENEVSQVLVAELLASLCCVGEEEAEQVAAVLVLGRILASLGNNSVDELVNRANVTREGALASEVERAQQLPEHGRSEGATWRTRKEGKGPRQRVSQ